MKLLYFSLIGGVIIIESKGPMFVTTPSQTNGLYHELILLTPLLFIAARTVHMFLTNGVFYAFGIKELLWVSSLRFLCRRWRLINRPCVDESGQMYQILVLYFKAFSNVVSLRLRNHNILFINMILASERIG